MYIIITNMKQYNKRISDRYLQKKLRAKGAVLVEGPKWCGKTTTAKQFANSTVYLQDPSQKDHNFRLIETNPSQILEGVTPRLIDEWQLAPKLWDAIRFEVDNRDEFGQFILTGSAVPANISEISHTGTGRISRMLMRPMSLYESKESSGDVSLGELFKGNSDIKGNNTLTLENIAFVICRGGWPKAIEQDFDIALEQAFDYFDAIINMDISRVDNVERNPQRAKRLMKAYSRAIGTQSKIPTIIEDIASNETDKISELTISSYIQALKKIFVIEDSYAWNPNLRSKVAIRTSETRYFTDPSIATASLGLGPKDLLNDLKTMGFFFENMCLRDLRVYSQVLDGEVYHYRDRSGLECDAVIHLRNGDYGLVEIKLGGDTLIEEGVKTLNKLSKNIDTTRMKAPSFKMIIIAVGDYAYKRADGILIVPIGCLKD